MPGRMKWNNERLSSQTRLEIRRGSTANGDDKALFFPHSLVPECFAEIESWGAIPRHAITNSRMKSDMEVTVELYSV